MPMQRAVPSSFSFVPVISVASLLAVLSLSGCGGSDNIQSTAAAPLSCAQLTGKNVPASAIGLPTTGATVTAATVMPASG
ncbi:hypothetical protein HDG32_000668 [Paraburkholderia sp. CI2]|nr:hypothetical protein [Paraburkholderia sp. CI2]